ncbi:LysM peptidoglycan-binding domain-containing protein [Halobacillus salinarum]|uniref:LysM peptidoglycan-binding domain-containing protein n=1 Tax=Halobacillus salinarum TaxID=2932257 RepID=A0ABY4EH78_9BACI|nr:LysM peptidoglycan-binding domain-containing protein [Halobacillus salinarum]UOQ42812.1 LysM peptidoglycan-binding domain-containing protein [Halobacillus salinarum]
MQVYVVQPGDTLWGISQRYNSSISQIGLLNGLNDWNRLVVGQALVIPELAKEYVVKQGDSLWGIAQQFGISVQELAQFNQITDPKLLYVGDLLRLPYVRYTVQPGDSLWAVARRFGVSVEEIMTNNTLSDPALIYAGQTLYIPAPSLPAIDVNAYTTSIDSQGAQEVLYLGRNFTYLSPFMHSVRNDGSVSNIEDAPLLEAAQANDVAPLFVLTNFAEGSFDSDLAATILRNPELQNKVISNVLNKMAEKHYSGLNIDFEYVYPEDRQNYNDFLKRVTEQLHERGYIVSTALAPKISGDQQGLLYEAHDYAQQAQIVDFIILMTYEWGWAGGRPWAIAPINKVKEVLDYAVTVIPRDKIVMGVPLYGRDWKIPWVEGTYARTVSPKQAVQLASLYGVPIQYNEQYQSPYFRYADEQGQQHEVWFEDARSVQAKYDVVKEYGLRGISYWVLGNPFPQNWPVLQTNFTVHKR